MKTDLLGEVVAEIATGELGCVRSMFVTGGTVRVVVEKLDGGFDTDDLRNYRTVTDEESNTYNEEYSDFLAGNQNEESF